MKLTEQTIDGAQRQLKSIMISNLMGAAIAAILFKMDPLGWTRPTYNPTVVFVMQATFELATLAAIVGALYMFKQNDIKAKLTTGLEAERALHLAKYGRWRLNTIGWTLIANICCYYMFGHTPSFFYMAVILLIAHVFIVPTKNRCNAETNYNNSQL